MQLCVARSSRLLAKPFRARTVTLNSRKLDQNAPLYHRRSIITIQINEKLHKFSEALAEKFDTSKALHKPLEIDEKQRSLGKLKWAIFVGNFAQAEIQLRTLVRLLQQNNEKLYPPILAAFTNTGINDNNAQIYMETVLKLPDDVLTDDLREKWIDMVFGSVQHRLCTVETVRLLADEIIPKYYPSWKKNMKYYAADLFCRVTTNRSLSQDLTTDGIRHVLSNTNDITALYTHLAELVVKSPFAFHYYDAMKFYATKGDNRTVWMNVFLRVVVTALVIRLPPRSWSPAKAASVLRTMQRDFLAHYPDSEYNAVFQAALGDLNGAFDTLMQAKERSNAHNDLFVGLLSFAYFRKAWEIHADLLREWQAVKFADNRFFDLPIEYVSHTVLDRLNTSGGKEAHVTLDKLLKNRADVFSDPQTASVPFFLLITALCRRSELRTAFEVYNQWLKLPRDKFPAPLGVPSCYSILVKESLKQGKPDLADELVKQMQEFVAVDYRPDIAFALIQVWAQQGKMDSVWKYGVERSKNFLANQTLTEQNTALMFLLKAFSHERQFEKAKKTWQEFVENRRVVPDALSLSAYLILVARHDSVLAALNFIKPYLQNPNGVETSLAITVGEVVSKSPASPFRQHRWRRDDPELTRRIQSKVWKLPKEEQEQFLADYGKWHAHFSQYPNVKLFEQQQ